MLSGDKNDDEKDYEKDSIESGVESRSERQIDYKSQGVRRRSVDFGKAIKTQKP